MQVHGVQVGEVMNNFLPLNRQITEHWLWADRPFSKGQSWIDLLMLANYEDKKIPYKGELILCKRGDVNLSIMYLANRWGWSRKKTTDFLSLLEKDGMVSVNATTHRTTITIVNYENFNTFGTTNNTAGEQQESGKETAKKRQGNITNKDNKGKSFIPPTAEEVKAYCDERGNNVNPQAFVDFYGSKGWMVGSNKMKDWQAAVRTWERKDGFKKKTKPQPEEEHLNFWDDE